MADAFIISGTFYWLEIASAFLIRIDRIPLLALGQDGPIGVSDGAAHCRDEFSTLRAAAASRAIDAP